MATFDGLINNHNLLDSLAPLPTVSGGVDATRRSIRFLSFAGSSRGPTTGRDNEPSPPYEQQVPPEPTPSTQGDEPQIGNQRNSIRRNVDLGTPNIPKAVSEKQLFVLEEEKMKKQGSLVTM